MDKNLQFLMDKCSYIFIQQKILKELREKYQAGLSPRLRKVVIDSITRDYILGIAALLDPLEDGRNRNISIRALKNIRLDQFKDTISKISTTRSKIIAHNDEPSIHQGAQFFSINEILSSKVEELFNYMLSCLEKELGRSMDDKVQISTGIESELARLLGQSSSGSISLE